MVLTAGAGFGKTTLLTQAWEENLLAPRGIDLWLGCIPGDAAESALAAGLIGATIPEGERSDDDGDVAATVAAAVWRRAPHQVALLVDDVHEIPSGSPGAALLTRILEVLPANGHLVLAGRTVPPLPLARLEAHGQVTRIHELDLAFSGDDSASSRRCGRSRARGSRACPAGRRWPSWQRAPVQTPSPTSCGRRCCPGSRTTVAACWPASPRSDRSTRRSPPPSPVYRSTSTRWSPGCRSCSAGRTGSSSTRCGSPC